MAVDARQANIGPRLILTQHHLGGFINGIGQFAMHRVVIFGAGRADGGGAAVYQEAAKRSQHLPVGIRLVENGAHGEIAAVHYCFPDLLALEGQHHQMSHIIHQAHRLHPAGKAE